MADWIPLGYARYATLSAAIRLGGTVPTAGAIAGEFNINGRWMTPTHALVTVEGQPVRVRDDGTAPTASEGDAVQVGGRITIDGYPNIVATQFIETAASAQITVRYYAERQ